ncbi:ROK family protein [Microbacterium sp. Marseille-Q6965]|uniref:ROK family protein n=1 Tax=Microbacterium sp. Marseille-Q6965 TaxID=2965072 RepID=UPI0021B7A8B7|nr:ROK family protein [Microbacterium sp. Marseille-Q6965]
MRALGIDYGGTHTKLLLLEGEREVARDTVDTVRLEGLADQVSSFLGDARPAAFGVTVAGTLDPVSGVVGRSANLPWLDGTAPARLLSQALGVPGVAVQDGEAAALAEARIGAGRGSDDVFVIALGTGIAGAHVSGGAVRRGAHGAAGEIGHLRVTAADHACSCGGRGCLETVIGGSQLGARWSERGGAGGTARDVVAAARAGDEAARAVLDDAARGLGRALLALSALVDPALVVVGGGVARAPEWTVEPALAHARAEATFHTLPDVAPAALGVWAGAHGAALAARDAAAARPADASSAART